MHRAQAVHPAYRPAWGRFWAGLAQKQAAGSSEVRSVDKAHVRVIAFYFCGGIQYLVLVLSTKLLTIIEQGIIF